VRIWEKENLPLHPLFKTLHYSQFETITKPWKIVLSLYEISSNSLGKKKRMESWAS
jgi:hypothetical protein